MCAFRFKFACGSNKRVTISRSRGLSGAQLFVFGRGWEREWEACRAAGGSEKDRVAQSRCVPVDEL